ncbi:MAG: hypothetical protein GY797_06285 [Deltaproteobacteria bacterium]|nr:hypothetical protein [Deltaproteobacteria bacterium]
MLNKIFERFVGEWLKEDKLSVIIAIISILFGIFSAFVSGVTPLPVLIEFLKSLFFGTAAASSGDGNNQLIPKNQIELLNFVFTISCLCVFFGHFLYHCTMPAHQNDKMPKAM